MASDTWSTVSSISCTSQFASDRRCIESCLRAAQRRLGDGGTQADGEQGEGVEQRRPRDAEQGEPGENEQGQIPLGHEQDGGEPESQRTADVEARWRRHGGARLAGRPIAARIGGQRAQLSIGGHRPADDGKRSDETFQRLQQQSVEEHAGEKREIRARVIVNATGVWGLGVEVGVGVANIFNSDERLRRTRGSKGAHVGVPRERVGNRDAVTLISNVDGRVMFCLPAGPQVIIGTKDTWTKESPESVHASAAEVDYLLRSANAYFPEARLTPDDVISAWAGIRPLASAGSSNPSAVSREHSIVRDRAGVINVTGGKLTTYRSMAAEIVDLVQDALGQPKKVAATDSVELPGAERPQKMARLRGDDSSLSTPLVNGLPYTGADLVYGVQNELAQTLSDLLIRRVHLAFETRDHGKSVAPRAADIVAPLLGWDDQTKLARVREFEEDIGRMFAIGNQ